MIFAIIAIAVIMFFLNVPLLYVLAIGLILLIVGLGVAKFLKIR